MDIRRLRHRYKMLDYTEWLTEAEFNMLRRALRRELRTYCLLYIAVKTFQYVCILGGFVVLMRSTVGNDYLATIATAMLLLGALTALYTTNWRYR